jgi:hypothetical protein
MGVKEGFRSFSIWNHSIGDEGDGGRPQLLQLGDRWVKCMLVCMLQFNTNTVTIKRTGSTLYDTNYEFIAAPHRPEGISILTPRCRKNTH